MGTNLFPKKLKNITKVKIIFTVIQV